MIYVLLLVVFFYFIKLHLSKSRICKKLTPTPGDIIFFLQVDHSDWLDTLIFKFLLTLPIKTPIAHVGICLDSDTYMSIKKSKTNYDYYTNTYKSGNIMEYYEDIDETLYKPYILRTNIDIDYTKKNEILEKFKHNTYWGSVGCLGGLNSFLKFLNPEHKICFSIECLNEQYGTDMGQLSLAHL